MNLVIIDDHLLFRQGLAGILAAQAGLRVVGQGETLTAAVELAGQHQPDVLLIEYLLSDGSALDALAMIHLKAPACKVILLTTLESDEVLFAALRAGAFGYLLKNMSVTELAQALREAEKGERPLAPHLVTRLMNAFSEPGAGAGLASQAAHLSRREREVLAAMIDGASNQQIAARLFLSTNTVKRHLQNIAAKLDLKGRRQLILFARTHHLE